MYGQSINKPIYTNTNAKVLISLVYDEIDDRLMRPREPVCC